MIDEEMKDITEAWNEAEKTRKKSNVCPHCGRCPECGRSDYPRRIGPYEWKPDWTYRPWDGPYWSEWRITC